MLSGKIITKNVGMTEGNFYLVCLYGPVYINELHHPPSIALPIFLTYLNIWTLKHYSTPVYLFGFQHKQTWFHPGISWSCQTCYLCGITYWCCTVQYISEESSTEENFSVDNNNWFSPRNDSGAYQAISQFLTYKDSSLLLQI